MNECDGFGLAHLKIEGHQVPVDVLAVPSELDTVPPTSYFEVPITQETAKQVARILRNYLRRNGGPDSVRQFYRWIDGFGAGNSL